MKRFNFHPEVCSTKPYPGHLMWNFRSLSLEVSVQLFFCLFCSLEFLVLLFILKSFLLILLLQSFLAFFFCILFESLNYCIYAIFNACKSSSSFFFLIESIYIISRVKRFCASSLISLFYNSLSVRILLLSILRRTQSILQGIYSFDKLAIAEFGNYLLYPYWYNSYCVHQWSGRPGFNPRSIHTKDSKNGT